MQDTLLIADNEPQAIRKTRTCMQIFFWDVLRFTYSYI